VQAARSGGQNIAEGSVASGTSKKTELKLTNVARASLEELKLDYEDYLRQRGLPIWGRDDSRRADLIGRRPETADDVAAWAKSVKSGRDGQHGQSRQRTSERKSQSPRSTTSMQSTESTDYPEIVANGVLALIAVATGLLGRQLATLEKNFLAEGGFTERLYRARIESRRK
jgi:four helix bundle suffix protein